MSYPDDVRERMFQCRDGLWDTFEGIARDQGVAIDQVLDEAMTAYARSRGQNMDTARPPAQARRRQPEPQDLDETMDAASRYQAAPMRGGTAPPPQMRGSPMMPQIRASAPALPQRIARPATAPLGLKPGGPSRAPPPLPPAMIAPGPHTQRLGDAPAPRTQMLVLTYNGETYTVDKDRYLLGRSKTQADLRLDDSNVSRQHAMIERVSNAWYVVDLGSTNGVYVDGERVARRAVRDGDIIEITTHRIECRIR